METWWNTLRLAHLHEFIFVVVKSVCCQWSDGRMCRFNVMTDSSSASLPQHAPSQKKEVTASKRHSSHSDGERQQNHKSLIGTPWICYCREGKTNLCWVAVDYFTSRDKQDVLLLAGGRVVVGFNLIWAGGGGLVFHGAERRFAKWLKLNVTQTRARECSKRFLRSHRPARRVEGLLKDRPPCKEPSCALMNDGSIVKRSANEARCCSIQNVNHYLCSLNRTRVNELFFVCVFY